MRGPEQSETESGWRGQDWMGQQPRGKMKVLEMDGGANCRTV